MQTKPDQNVENNFHILSVTKICQPINVLCSLSFTLHPICYVKRPTSYIPGLMSYVLCICILCLIFYVLCRMSFATPPQRKVVFITKVSATLFQSTVEQYQYSQTVIPIQFQYINNLDNQNLCKKLITSHCSSKGFDQFGKLYSLVNT
jgi:hypothetical protein